MKNGIYKVKRIDRMDEIMLYKYKGVEFKAEWLPIMEANCPKSRRIRVRDSHWNISGVEYIVCPQMFEAGPL